MKKNKLFVFSISSLIILGVIGLSGNGFAAFVPPGGGGSPPPPPPPPTVDKYGFFFYSTDAGHNEGNIINAEKIKAHIDNYKSILLGKGYDQVLVYEDVEDSYDLTDCFDDDIYPLVDEDDVVFFYLWGHGRSENGHSYVKLNPFTNHNKYEMTSLDFNSKLDGLDTTKIGFLVDSCYSGGFVYDFIDDPYLAMSSADTGHESMINWVTGEALFSAAFWWAAETLTDEALLCWNWAANWNSVPVPLFYNGLSDYTFF